MDQRDCVYVIGAGFSAGLGFPLTSDLLVRLWDRIDKRLRKRLKRVIRFHHPEFDPKRFTTFPDVEQLLSELQVNEQLFGASRQYGGKFTKVQLQNLQTDLLLQVATWFHEISKDVFSGEPTVDWLEKFRRQVIRQNASIVSFNWDLILDQLLFGDAIDGASYGFKRGESGGPSLLKPHGSLNWFEEDVGRRLKRDRRVRVFRKGSDAVFAFRRFRAPVLRQERITPLIVPPVYLKNFEKPVFRKLWRNCVALLSQAREVVFLGYSLPLADLHARFIMRCGFRGPSDRRPIQTTERTNARGAANVVIVNPDWGAARRISAIVGSEHKCSWVSTSVSDWIQSRPDQ
ncbi:MAG: hypothetical protein F4X12_01925 [Acidobacteriia bacterium]|nr:hypothetical protein [Terriglobia bacterium]